MREKVLQCLRSACPNIDFETTKLLVDEGILDSLAIITIISALMETFSIEIDADDIVSDNFNSLNSLILMIEKKKSAC